VQPVRGHAKPDGPAVGLAWLQRRRNNLLYPNCPKFGRTIYAMKHALDDPRPLFMLIP
jgi:hypothetical protein